MTDSFLSGCAREAEPTEKVFNKLYSVVTHKTHSHNQSQILHPTVEIIKNEALVIGDDPRMRNSTEYSQKFLGLNLGQ